MLNASESVKILDASLKVDALPTEGKRFSVETDAGERQSVATLMKVEEVVRLDARLTARRFRGGVEVSGELFAEVIQNSVVSLEPLHQQIEETISRVFMPVSKRTRGDVTNGEIVFSYDDADPPDTYAGPVIDLTDFLLESLALAIEPYPRRPDETLEVPQEDDGEDVSPFVALEVLKGKGD